MTSVNRTELLARLVYMRDVCGLDPANGIRAAFMDREITLATARWLTAKIEGA